MSSKRYPQFVYLGRFCKWQGYMLSNQTTGEEVYINPNIIKAFVPNTCQIFVDNHFGQKTMYPINQDICNKLKTELLSVSPAGASYEGASYEELN